MPSTSEMSSSPSMMSSAWGGAEAEAARGVEAPAGDCEALSPPAADFFFLLKNIMAVTIVGLVCGVFGFGWVSLGKVIFVCLSPPFV